MARVAWVFTDLTDSSTYSWEVNPLDGNDGTFEKSITYQSTAAPDGRLLIFEGRDQPNNASWTGTILSQNQYDTLKLWYQKRHQVQIEDDLGRTFIVYVTKFSPQRVRNTTYPWKHTYSIEYVIIEETTT